MIEVYERLEEEGGELVRCEAELDLVENAPKVSHPFLLWLFIKTAEKQKDNLVLFKTDLAKTLYESINAEYAGSLERDGWCELYFYAPDPKRFENLTSDVMSRHGGFAYERGNSRDAKWELYLEQLYPDDYALLSIQNRHTIDALIDAGDDLSVPREIEHYIFFQTKSALERTVDSLAKEGFTLKDYLNDEENEYTYGAILVKNEDLLPDTVKESTTVCFETSLQNHGLYEGWSTTLAEDDNGTE